MGFSLLFQGFRPGLFYDVSTRAAPSAFPSTGLSAMSSRSNGSGLRFPPLISREKDSGLRLGRARRGPPVTAKNPHVPPPGLSDTKIAICCSVRNFSITSDHSFPLLFAVIARSAATWQSLAQTWLKRDNCIPQITKIVPRFHYVTVSSHQGGLVAIMEIASLRSQ
jgi:hypothetical protein